MKKSILVQIIKEAVAAKKSSLTDKVKAVSVPVSKLQKGDIMAADKSKVTSIKKDGDNFEITLSGGKKLNYKKDKQVQIVRAGSTLNEGTDTNWKDLWLALQGALAKEDDAESDRALKLIAKVAGSKIKRNIEQGAEKLKAHLEKDELEEGVPSAGMTAKEKSAVVKKAKAGSDIGKKGPGFAKVEKAAEKEYGSKEAGQKVAAAAMWKAQAKK